MTQGGYSLQQQTASAHTPRTCQHMPLYAAARTITTVAAQPAPDLAVSKQDSSFVTWAVPNLAQAAVKTDEDTNFSHAARLSRTLCVFFAQGRTLAQRQHCRMPWRHSSRQATPPCWPSGLHTLYPLRTRRVLRDFSEDTYC